VSPRTPKAEISALIGARQEGQHELTGQRAANFRRDLWATYRTLIAGYLESPFSTACLL